MSLRTSIPESQHPPVIWQFGDEAYQPSHQELNILEQLRARRQGSQATLGHIGAAGVARASRSPFRQPKGAHQKPDWDELMQLQGSAFAPLIEWLAEEELSSAYWAGVTDGALEMQQQEAAAAEAAKRQAVLARGPLRRAAKHLLDRIIQPIGSTAKKNTSKPTSPKMAAA